MATHTLKVRNESSEPWDIFTFQKDPGRDIGSVVASLAWFAKYAAAHSQVTFSWDVKYSLMWSRTGTLAPGVVFDASQSFPADPAVARAATAEKDGDQTTLTYHAERDYFEFVDGVPVAEPSPGTLYVSTDPSVPNGLASVGIGMSDAGIFAVPALGNMTVQFTPRPRYYVAVSTGVKQGQVLEEATNAVELPFDGRTALTATFRPDHTWSVSPS